MPLVVLYAPSTDLLRQGGRITDSGNIIVNRPVPFRLVKEVWFCVPEGDIEGNCEILEKIMDESLEDELVLDYKASPILDGYKRYWTPAHVMTILCEMPTGPHQAEKERLLRELAAAVDYPLNDDRREHHMREAVIFMIKHTRPGDLYALEVEMTKFECASVRPATTQHPLVSRDARNAGRSSSHAESSGEENLPKRMHPWRFQAPTLSKRWKQQPQQHQPKMTISWRKP